MRRDLADHGGGVAALLDGVGRGRRDQVRPAAGASRRARRRTVPSAPRSRSESSSRSSGGASPSVGAEHRDVPSNRSACATRPSTPVAAAAALRRALQLADPLAQLRDGLGQPLGLGLQVARQLARRARSRSRRSASADAAGDGLDAAHALADRRLRQDLERAHLGRASARACRRRARSRSPTIVDDAHDVAVLLAEQHRRAERRAPRPATSRRCAAGSCATTASFTRSSTSASSLRRHRAGRARSRSAACRAARPSRAGARGRRAPRAAPGAGGACRCGSPSSARGGARSTIARTGAPAAIVPCSSTTASAWSPSKRYASTTAPRPGRALERRRGPTPGRRPRGRTASARSFTSRRPSPSSCDRLRGGLDVELARSPTNSVVKPASRANAAARSRSACRPSRPPRARGGAARPSARAKPASSIARPCSAGDLGRDLDREAVRVVQPERVVRRRSRRAPARLRASRSRRRASPCRSRACARSAPPRPARIRADLVAVLRRARDTPRRAARRRRRAGASGTATRRPMPLAVRDGAADDAAQDVAALLVRRDHAVGGEERHAAAVVGEHAQRRVCDGRRRCSCAPDHASQAAMIGLEAVGLVDGVDALQQRATRARRRRRCRSTASAAASAPARRCGRTA